MYLNCSNIAPQRSSFTMSANLSSINFSFIKPPKLRTQLIKIQSFSPFSRFYGVTASRLAFSDGFEDTQLIKIQSLSHFSRFCRVSASTLAFADGFEDTQNVQLSEAEEVIEDEGVGGFEEIQNVQLSEEEEAVEDEGVGGFEEIQNVQVSEAEEEDEEEEDEGVGGFDEEEGVVSQEAEERRLYVGNLPYSMTSKQLADIFAEAGSVITVEIIYDRVTDRSRGFAFVTMKSVEEANEAIRMFDGSQVGGRTVRVNIPEVPKGGEKEVMRAKIKSSYQGFIDSPHKLYAGNLSWNLTSQGLREAFSSQPGLVSAKVVYERDSGRSRGFGFITFGSAEEVESALNAMNGVEVEGRPLRLNLAEQRASVSPPLVTENNPEGVLNESVTVTNPADSLNESVTGTDSENVLTENEVTANVSI
ncbi:hypothetical protein Leryth_000987 [Lithospermum erythrorhizon]|nr:hypothetical protein Leryth_000987 [Lithospermum erythrorhizon]